MSAVALSVLGVNLTFAESQPFGAKLHRLLLDREEFRTKTGNINWRAVANALDGVHYETLRKAVTGERLPAVSLLEQCAELAGVSPGEFVEFQLAQAQRAFDVREVGWDEAMANLRKFAEVSTKPRRK